MMMKRRDGGRKRVVPLGSANKLPVICIGCSVSLDLMDRSARLCSDCSLEMIVYLAGRIAPAVARLTGTPQIDVAPSWGRRVISGRLVTDADLERSLALPGADDKPPGEVWVWERAMAVWGYYVGYDK